MQFLLKLRAHLGAYGLQIGAALISLSVVILGIGLMDFLLRRLIGLPKDVAFYLTILALCTLVSLVFPRLRRPRPRSAPPVTTDDSQEG